MIMRYIPHTSKDVEAMMKVIGVTSVNELFEAIPKSHQLTKPLDLPPSLSEMELRKQIETLAFQNEGQHYLSFLGGGCYHHYVPSIVNYLASQGGFLTSYTPYQPEISQGTLQTTFEFQTMIARLTGMELANASMYDGATALAEACLMAKRLKTDKTKILIPKNLHPEYQQVCQAYLETQDIELLAVEYDRTSGQISAMDLQSKLSSDCAAVIVQQPNFFGIVEHLKILRTMADSVNALLIVAIPEPLSLGLLKPPGEYNADIVVGEAQSFGNPPSFGGPHVGFFATQNAYVRAIPGRIVGETTDKKGRRCYTLTLSTREQHIRREKATSNICTNQALLATRAAIYLSTVGEQGLKKLALWNHSLANILAKKLKTATLKFASPFFNELVVECSQPIKDIEQNLRKNKILGGISLEEFYPELKNCLLICPTEIHSQEDIERLCDLL